MGLEDSAPPYNDPMPRHVRFRVGGGTYFLTLVTCGRAPILTTPTARAALRESLGAVRHRWPFDLDAVVLLPDHLHTVWTLPPGDTGYPTRVSRLKELFTRRFVAAGGAETAPTPSRVRKRERGVWQRRFWEHAVRDADDFKRCLDYLHYNPVKHGLVARVADYPWSSFHRWVAAGEHPPEWGEGPAPADVPGAEWE